MSTPGITKEVKDSFYTLPKSAIPIHAVPEISHSSGKANNPKNPLFNSWEPHEISSSHDSGLVTVRAKRRSLTVIMDALWKQLDSIVKLK